jgi:F0F1-type ATP synthase assembly protein I
MLRSPRRGVRVLNAEAMADESKRSSRGGGKGRASWTRLAGIGFELVAAVGAFILVGYWWDRHFGTGPKGLVVGAVLGLIGGMYNLIRQSLLATREAAGGSDTSDGDKTR